MNSVSQLSCRSPRVISRYDFTKEYTQSSGLSGKGLNESRGWGFPMPEVLSLAVILISKASAKVILESRMAANVCILWAVVRAKRVTNLQEIVSKVRLSCGNREAKWAITGDGSQTKSYLGRWGLRAATPLKNLLTNVCEPSSSREIREMAER